MLEPPQPSQEIVEWLNTLRLSQYTSCFQAGGYEALEDCKDLTDERLLELRVFPTGHRRRILRSLEALGLNQQSGDEDDDEEGGTANGRRRRTPVPHPRHIFMKDKKRGVSCQHRPPTDRRDLEGSLTLPPGVGLGTQTEDDPEGGYVHPPRPAPRNPQNIKTSAREHSSIPVSMSSCSSSSSESFSIFETPSDWEVSSEDPLLSIDSIPCPTEAPRSALAGDSGGFCGEMVENSIYEAQPSFKPPAGPRLTRSYRLRHRPVPEIPSQTLPPLQDRYAYRST